MKKKITDSIYYVGVNDRQKHLFENLWPLPYGVAYNSYVIVDEKTVLVDTVDVCYADIFFKKVDEILQGRPLDYLIVNHMEPDHAGSIRLLRYHYPDLQIIGNKKTFDMLKGFHDIDTGLYEVKEGDTLSIGAHTLNFYMAPMVHWPEVMVTYESTSKTLFSADAFGTYGTVDGGYIDQMLNTDHYWEEMIRYYSNIVGKYGAPVQKALKKLSALPIETICATHGPVWTKAGELSKVINIYDKLSRYEGEDGVVIAYGSMYGHTEQMADTLAAALSEAGVRNIVLHNVSKSHPSYILKDIFKYKGLIIGAPTYCNCIFPGIETLLSKIQMREVKNRHFAYFGNFSWANMASKRLAAFSESMKWQVIGTPVEQKQAGTVNTEASIIALANEIAKAF